MTAGADLPANRAAARPLPATCTRTAHARTAPSSLSGCRRSARATRALSWVCSEVTAASSTAGWNRHGGTLSSTRLPTLIWEAQAQLVGALGYGLFMRRAGGAGQHRRTRHRDQRDLHRVAEEGSVRTCSTSSTWYRWSPLLREHREDIPELPESAVDRLVGQDKLPYRRFRSRHRTCCATTAGRATSASLKNRCKGC